MSKIKLSDHFTAGRLFRFVLPSVAMMVFISIYGVVDGFFVSNFAGKTSFASINLIMPFVMILGGVGFMVGTGGTALVSQKLGEGDEKTAKRYFTMMIMLTVILGAVLTTFGLIFTENVAVFFGATPEMLGDCVLYGRIVNHLQRLLCSRTYSRAFLLLPRSLNSDLFQLLWQAVRISYLTLYL